MQRRHVDTNTHIHICRRMYIEYLTDTQTHRETNMYRQAYTEHTIMDTQTNLHRGSQVHSYVRHTQRGTHGGT